MRIEKHMTILGRIYLIYGILGIALILLALVLIVWALCDLGLEGVGEIDTWTWTLMPVLLLAGMWYVFNIFFGLALKCGRRWATGIVGKTVSSFGLFLLPIGTPVSVYLLWVLRQKKRMTEPLNSPCNHSAALHD